MKSITINFNTASESKQNSPFKLTYNYKHLHMLIDLNRPAQKVLVGILGLFETPSNSMVCGNTINLSQADMSKMFDMCTTDVSTGIKQLLLKKLLLKQGKLYCLNSDIFKI